MANLLHGFRRLIGALVVMLIAGAATLAIAADLNTRYTFTIPSQSLSSALLTFSEQAKIQVMTASADLAGLTSPGVSGDHTAREALDALLRGSGLQFRSVAADAVAIEPVKASSTTSTSLEETPRPLVLGQAPSPTTIGSDPSAKSRQSPESRIELEEIEVAAMPEILVVGSRILNMDIPRTRDDPQPYVIFDRAVIEKSGANTIEDFLKQRLPMNVQGATNSQGAGFMGNTSSINLRGLGTSQTLILVDGHRTAGPSPIVTGESGQTDINGIPLAAVERIEILPTTASGIYGGSATGGVVNIVLRRDYSGMETTLTYENTFDSDAAQRRVDMSAGFSLEDGRTRILLAGSYSDANELVVADRDFLDRGRATILQNNPSALLSAVTPPLGATPNIRSVNGSPLFGPGSPNYTFVPEGYAGGGGLAPFQANAGQYNLGPADTRQQGRQALVNAPTIESLMVTLRREFSPSVQAFLDLAGSKNAGSFVFSNVSSSFTVAANAPNNPFGQAVRVRFPTAAQEAATESEYQDGRIVGGVIVKLPKAWTGELDYTWNRAQYQFDQPLGVPANAIAPAISNGTLDVLRDTLAYPLDLVPYLYSPAVRDPFKTTLKNVAMRLAGPIGTLPAGAPQLSMLIEHRDEIFHAAREDNFGNSASHRVLVYPERSQSVDSLYLEMRVPLVSASNRVPGMSELELQIAGRHDDYTVEGTTDRVNVASPVEVVRATNKRSSTNPTFGVRYRPVQDVMLRASYGTGFLPPSVQQLVPNPAFNLNIANLTDPKRDNTPVPPVNISSSGNGTIPLITGGAPDLRPEESESWSAGLIVTPRVLPGLRLSVDYTRIDKTDVITFLPDTQYIINEEDLLPGRVTRGANLPGDLPGWPGPIVGVDGTAVNVARAEVEAFDIALDYSKETLFGTFDFFAVATRQTHYKTQLVPSAPLVENVGVNNSPAGMRNPLGFKGNAGITWSYGGWELGWTSRYVDSYRLTDPTQVLSQGNDGRVPSQLYHDAVGTYRFDTAASWLDGTELQVGVKNLFNTRPPFDASFQYFYSPYGDPRLASYYVSLKKSF